MPGMTRTGIAVAFIVGAAAAQAGCRKTQIAEPGQQTPEQIRDLKLRAAALSPMIRIPGGCFTMGTDNPPPPPKAHSERDRPTDLCILSHDRKEACWGMYEDESPAHDVCVDPYEIDEHEVTFGAYRLCAETLECEPLSLSTDPDFMGDRRPAAGVSWTAADTFCRWMGRRLPTEAEWEFAARGSEGRTYPWGEEPPSCERLAMRLGEGPDSCGRYGTKNVGAYPLDKSPFGVLDMGGNLREWVQDWYDPSYYETLAGTRTWNPKGPEENIVVIVNEMEPGEYVTMPEKARVVRGGTFLVADPITSYRATNRRGLDIEPRTIGPLISVGFRCARSLGGRATPL